MSTRDATDDQRQAYEKRLRTVVREKTDLHDAEGLDNSMLIADLNDLKIKYDTWQQELPGIQPFYAVKCNEDHNVLQTLARLGCSFDCASKHEIQTVLNLGVDSTRIIFANPVKAVSMLKFAETRDVSLMTFDNEEELYKIKKHFPAARLILRIKVDGDDNTVYRLNQKFGCPLERARQLLSSAYRLDLTVIGVSFHVGSNITDASAYTSAIRDARSVHEIGEELGFNMHVLDIGGGFPGHSKSSALFRDFARTVREAMQTFYSKVDNLRVIAEPGRFFVESAFTLCVNVIGKSIGDRGDTNDQDGWDSADKEFEHLPKNNTIRDGGIDIIQDILMRNIGNDDPSTTKPKLMYYLNDGVYGHLGAILVEGSDSLEVLTVQDCSGRPRFISSLWGPTCDSVDFIKDDVNLPELHPGDWLYLRDAGAYWSSQFTRFNGMPPPAKHFVCLPDI